MARRRGRSRKRPSGALTPKQRAEAVQLTAEQILAAVDQGQRNAGPDYGQRTPQPTIQSTQDRVTFQDLEWHDVNQILRRAKNGDMRDLADLRMRVRTDGHLLSVWETRQDPILGARWEVTPPEEVDDVSREVAKRAAKGCEEALHGVRKLEDAFSALLAAEDMGYGVCEILWTRGTLLGRPANVPKAILPVHPRRFRFDNSYELGLYDDGRAASELEAAGIPFDLTADTRVGRTVRLPAGKYIVHQPRLSGDYPTMGGLIRTTVRLWWVKGVLWKYWLGGAEAAANPRMIGYVGQNAPAEVNDAIVEALENLAADGVAVLRVPEPSNMGSGQTTRIELLQSNSESTGRTWGDLHAACDASMSKAVLGSTQTVESADAYGSRATAQVQADETIAPRRERDASAMWQSIRDGLFRFIVDYNPHLFPPGTPVPVGRHVLAEDPVEVDDLLVSVGGATVNEVRESRGLPPWTDARGDAVAKAPEPAAPMFTDAPAREVAAADPFPWRTAEALSRDWSAAMATSTPSPTSPPTSLAKRSRL
jgi:hypothetical protein